MFDHLLPTAASKSLVLFDIIIYLAICIILYRAKVRPYYVNTQKRKLAVCLMSLFVLFSFWGTDWFSYYNLYPALKSGSSGHMETIYVWIAQNLTFGYLSFRLVVFCGSLLIVLFIFKRIELNMSLALFFLGAIWLIWLSYSRVSLAMAIMFIGATYIFKPSFKYPHLSNLIGFLLLFSSFLFHKTAAVGILAIIVSIFVRRIGKGILVIIAVILPLLLIFISDYLQNFLLLDIDTSNELLDFYMSNGQRNLENETENSGVGSIIQFVLERLPYYLLAWMGYKIQSGTMKDVIPSYIRAFGRILFFVVLFSSFFFFDLGVNTSTLYARFLRFSIIPCTILLTYFYQNDYHKKYIKKVYVIGLSGTLYSLVYSFYVS